MRHPNLDRLERGLKAFAARDLATLREIFFEDVLWHYSGTSSLAGEYRGLEEVFELFARRAALSHDSYRLVVQQAIANDDFVTVIGSTRAKREDAQHEDSIVLVYRIERDKVTEAWALPGHPEAERAFYG